MQKFNISSTVRKNMKLQTIFITITVHIKHILEPAISPWVIVPDIFCFMLWTNLITLLYKNKKNQLNSRNYIYLFESLKIITMVITILTTIYNVRWMYDITILMIAFAISVTMIILYHVNQLCKIYDIWNSESSISSKIIKILVAATITFSLISFTTLKICRNNIYTLVTINLFINLIYIVMFAGLLIYIWEFKGSKYLMKQMFYIVGLFLHLLYLSNHVYQSIEKLKYYNFNKIFI